MRNPIYVKLGKPFSTSRKHEKAYKKKAHKATRQDGRKQCYKPSDDSLEYHESFT